MLKDFITSDTAENWDCLDEVSSGIFILNKQFQILRANRYIRSLMIDIIGDISHGDSCHNVLFGHPYPCENCPLRMSENELLPERSFIIKKRNGVNSFFRERMSVKNGVIFLTFQDVTREIYLLKETDLRRKELRAKNILLDKRNKDINAEKKDLTQMIDNLPEALVTIDSSMSIGVLNLKAKEDFPAGSAEKCYELIGKNRICESCPVEGGFPAGQEVKTSHTIDGRVYTEIIKGFENGKEGLLLFRDNTRQVSLIEQIKKQSETLNRKNNILSCLVKLETRMQEEEDIKKVFEYFFDLFLPLFQSESIVLIVSDISAGSVWFSLSRGVTDSKVNMLTKAFFSRDIHTVNPYSIPEDARPWQDTCQINLEGKTNKLVGMIFVKGKCSDDNLELIELFKDSLSKYIHNQILIKLLKEKANTDPLTGLFNRRYLEKAIEKGENNFKAYDVHYSVAVVDINRLKEVNDIYGHEAGDRIINIVAGKLKESTRDSDIVARTGGDEFIILLTNTDTAGAEKYLYKLDNKIFKNLFVEINRRKRYKVSVSSGIASSDSCPSEDLIRKADREMYEKKRAYYSNGSHIAGDSGHKLFNEVEYVGAGKVSG